MSAAPTTETKPTPPPRGNCQNQGGRPEIMCLSSCRTGRANCSRRRCSRRASRRCRDSALLLPSEAGRCRQLPHVPGGVWQHPMLARTRKPVLNPDGTAKIARSVLPYEPGTPRGAISCATPISPGMEIYASSPPPNKCAKRCWNRF